MKRIFLIYLLFGLCSSFVFAQTSDSLHRPSGYISLNGGIGLPVGGFGSTSHQGDKDVYASKGGVYDIFFDSPIRGNSLCHFISLLGYNTYTIDYVLQYRHNGTFTQGIYGRGSYIFDVNTGINWVLTTMPGLAIMFPKKCNRLGIEIKLLVGAAYSHYAYLSYESVQQQQGVIVQTHINPSDLFEFAFESGIGLHYFLNKKLAARLNMDYFFVGGATYLTTISLIKLTAGIGYCFGR